MPHIRGWVGGWGGQWAKVTLWTQWDQLMCKEAVNGLQTTLHGKAGRLITVMDDWSSFTSMPPY